MEYWEVSIQERPEKATRLEGNINAIAPTIYRGYWDTKTIRPDAAKLTAGPAT